MSENRLLLKRLLVVLAAILIISIVFVAPRIYQDTTAAHKCDAAVCNLPAAVNLTPGSNLISEENWQFTLPGFDWTPQYLQDVSIKVAFIGSELEHSILVLFIKEEDPDINFSSFVINTHHTFTTMGFMLNSIKQVVIDNNKYILLQVNHGDDVIWNWMTFKNGIGYNLACGAEINSDVSNSQHDLCFSIADSLRIQ
jgi:hypothetical protein